MKIVATQQELARAVNRADHFTSKTLGSPPHMECILVEVDATTSTVTFTAESANSAITFTPVEKIDVLDGGRFLVRSADLRGVLAVIQSDERVTLETKNREKELLVTGGRTEVRIPLFELSSERVVVPTVGRPDLSFGVLVNAADFNTAFLSGSAAADRADRWPVLKGVHVTTIGDTLRFFSFDKAATTFTAVPAEKIGEDADEAEFEVLLDPDVTRTTLDFIRQGKTLRIHPSTEGKLAHYLVFDEEGGLLYHLRVATLAHDPSAYPVEKIRSSISSRLSPSIRVLVMDKLDMIRLFRNAEAIAALNRSAQDREVGVAVTRDVFRTEIDGSISHSEECELKSWTGADFSMQFKWGLYGSLIESYPSSEEIRLAVIERKDGTPHALALYLDAEWDPATGSIPEDYFTIVPLSNGAYAPRG